MRWRLTRLLLILLLGFAGVVALSWWQDPLYWSRWLDVMTHQSPDYMNFRPTASVGGDPIREIPAAADDDARTIAPAALREAEQYAAEFDSYALIVVHHGVVQTEWYAPGWSPERLTQSQSMMKTLAALTVGLAIADGYIKSVDEPVSSYLPEWAGDPRGAIRIRDLLQMASGLAQSRFTFNPFAEDSVFRVLVSSDRPAEYLRIRAAMAPGREFDYNDMDAALVGLIVQRATGMPWQRWLDQKIWRPMGGAPGKVWLDRDAADPPDPVTGSVSGDGPLAMTACCMLARCDGLGASGSDDERQRSGG
ncbi:MAG: serine hydrolase [Gammaproteobacteria bacterium]